MKFLPICCILSILPVISSAETPPPAQNPTFPDTSLFKKDELKKLPRLGMTLNQLRILWGNQTTTDGEATIWSNIGGINLQATFSPTFLTDTGFFIDPNKSRCLSITFASPDNVPLNPEEVVKIAQALLPGATFQYSISQEVETGPFRNPEKVTFTMTGKEKTYRLRDNRQERNSYIIEFTVTPKTVKIETDQL